MRSKIGHLLHKSGHFDSDMHATVTYQSSEPIIIFNSSGNEKKMKDDHNFHFWLHTSTKKKSEWDWNHQSGLGKSLITTTISSRKVFPSWASRGASELVSWL